MGTVSATPEQIAELCKRLDEPSNWMKEGRANEDWNTLRGTYDKAPFEAATLIRAQAERVSVLEEALEALQYVMVAHGKQLHDAFDQAHKAIAKATGAPQ